MDSTTLTLPPLTTLSSSALSFLNDNLTTNQCLSRATRIASELETQCRDLDQRLIELNSSLGSKLIAYSSFSDRVNGLFDHVNVKLTDLASVTCFPSSFPDGGGRAEQILGEELPVLAKEVARVEAVRAYAGECFCYLLLKIMEESLEQK